MRPPLSFMKRRWCVEDLDILRREYPVSDLNQLAERLGKTISAVKSKAKLLGIVRSESVRVWNKGRVKILMEIYPDMRNSEIASVIGVSESAVSGMAFKLGLKKSREFKDRCSGRFRFRQGCVPANKGKRMCDFMSAEQIERSAATRFRKGHVPANHKPLGYERINRDGYTEVKVAEPNVFRLKHRMIWEEANGPIPEGCNIQFRDGNKRNITLGNLYIISRSEQLRTQNSIYSRYPGEVIQLLRLKGTLKRQINKFQKHGDKHRQIEGDGPEALPVQE